MLALPPLSIRAALSSFNAQERTVDLIFSTGAGVERYDYMTSGRYLEELEISRDAIDFSRLNAGAPLLDSHSAYSVNDILGAVVPGSARVDGRNAVATTKFSSRPAVQGILQDIQDGVIRSVSVGYRVGTYQRTPAKDGKIETRIATRWTPYELSLVSMPADVGAHVRGAVGLERCIIVDTRGEDVEAADRAQIERFNRLVAEGKQHEDINSPRPLSNREWLQREKDRDAARYRELRESGQQYKAWGWGNGK